jgi:hypothetical protein
VLELAGRDYEHAAGAIFACRRERCNAEVELEAEGIVELKLGCASSVATTKRGGRRQALPVSGNSNGLGRESGDRGLDCRALIDCEVCTAGSRSSAQSWPLPPEAGGANRPVSAARAPWPLPSFSTADGDGRSCE